MSQDGASRFQNVIQQQLELSLKKKLEKIPQHHHMRKGFKILGINVPTRQFLSVKTTSDLLLVTSNLTALTQAL
uniref:Uncharacterized protein n=1 Tax=Suricata suricatta TaxID=37032 RepID=A0A673UFZ4_SURSU